MAFWNFNDKDYLFFALRESFIKLSLPDKFLSSAAALDQSTSPTPLVIKKGKIY